MINRQLSRLLLCSILGSTTLISGCALVRKDSAPHQQLKPEQIMASQSAGITGVSHRVN